MNGYTMQSSPQYVYRPSQPLPEELHPSQFAAELPSQWQGGDANSGPINTQFRHELSNSYLQQPPISQTPQTWRFVITTENDSLSSGFPYHQRLRDFGILQDQWYRFTNEVITATKLTRSEDAAAWTAGVATGTASSAFLLVFAPVAGYYAGKSVHKKTVVKKVKEKLGQDSELRAVLQRWNDGAFRERGIQTWLEPPSGSGDVLVDVTPGMKPKDIERQAKRQARRFTIVITPCDLQSPTTGHWSPQNSPVPSPIVMQKPQISPVLPQYVLQSSWVPQSSSPTAQAVVYPTQSYPNNNPSLPSAFTPNAQPTSQLVQVQELGGTAVIPTSAHELDASEVPHR